MPRGAKKVLKKEAYENFVCTDFRLEDFANNHVAAVRRKLVNSVSWEVKNLRNLERSWFEDNDKVFDDSSEEEASFTPGKKRSKSKIKQTSPNPDDTGVIYPLDVWFIISQYINPEDVRIFACLCKSSYFVSQTYSFWISLYKRYYNSDARLPLRLRACCIERPHSLKMCVVRALYHFYPRFSKQISVPHSLEIYNLSKLVCVSMWHVHVDSQKWLFCFKLKSPSSTARSSHVAKDDVDKMWDTYEYDDPKKLMNDVNKNPEEGCRVLKVTSPHFVAVPLVMGGSLVDVKMGLALDLKQKLQLVFSFSNYKQTRKNTTPVVSRNCGGSGEILEFNSVENVMVLDWWHPQYPSSNSFL